MKVDVRSLFGVGLLMGLMACGSDYQGANSDIKVTNGISASQEDFPAVVQLSLYSGWSGSICTGTWVNDHQVITAAHCVYSNPKVYAGNIRALSYHRQEDYSMNVNGGVNPLDLAIVNFPAGSAPATRQLIAKAPERGVEALIVGFGNNVIGQSKSGGISGSGAGQLRYGRNAVAGMSEDGMLQIVGVPKAKHTVEGEEIPLGDYASTGSGDSGGPIFVDGKLAGVTSGGGIGELESGELVAIGMFTDLNSEASQAFLDKYLD